MIPLTKLLAELKECSISRNLERGRQLHEIINKIGSGCDGFVASTLINMYAKCCCIKEAHAVFNTVCRPDVVSWTALILGYANNGEGRTALELFSRMRLEGYSPNAITFVAALKACTDIAYHDPPRFLGKQVHMLASLSGCDSDKFVGNTLIDMYAKCRDIREALNAFEMMRNKDAVSWNVLISGYADNGEGFISLSLFSRMRREGCPPDARTFLAVLMACNDLVLKEQEEGKPESRRRLRQLHLLASVSGYNGVSSFANSLVDLYSKCGSMDEAHAVFDVMENPDVVAWTSLISGYTENGNGAMALHLMARIKREGCTPDERTIVAGLKACTALSVGGNHCLVFGEVLHLIAIKGGFESDAYVKCTLVDMYAKAGNIQRAYSVFLRIRSPDIVSWNALILGYVENGDGSTSLNLFVQMHREGRAPDGRTFVAALKACTVMVLKEDEETGDVSFKERGKALHLVAIKAGYESDNYVKVTLLDMYAKCGSMSDASVVFEGLDRPNVLSWTSLMLGYVESGKPNISLELFDRMKSEGCEPDGYAFATALKACGMLGALEYGKVLYTEIRSRYLVDTVLATCLIDFFAKCGSLVDAERVLEHHPTRDLITWNALIAGYSRRGDAENVFSLFEKMVSDVNVKPDGITFMCLLTACSHSGLVEKGKSYFEEMSTKYGVAYELDHFTCMIDMFGRSNKLEEAMGLLRSMPFDENGVIWMTVLGACQKWKNVMLGSLAFENLVSLDDVNPPAYVLMANLYGSKGMWKDQTEIQANERHVNNVWKSPGKCWWSSRAGVVHTF